MTESQIQKEITDYITVIGGLVFRMNAGGRGHNIKRPPPGTPDLLIVHSNKALWIEVKTIDGKVSAIQGEMHTRLKSMGQNVIIARSINDVLKELSK